MCCITSVSYSILMNGATTDFFHVERGLRQGCPLSPLIFLLIMEGLSRCVIDERDRGRLKDIRIVEDCILTHLIFVDDIIIFLNGYLGDSTVVTSILLLLCTSTGMQCNNSKSTMTCQWLLPTWGPLCATEIPFHSHQIWRSPEILGVLS